MQGRSFWHLAATMGGVLTCLLMLVHDETEAADDPRTSLASAELASAEPAGGLKIDISTTKEVFRPLEPIKLRIVVTNVSKDSILLTIRSPWYLYDVIARHEKEVMPLTRHGQRMREAAANGSRIAFKLPAGEERIDTMVLNRGIDMTRSGAYLVHVTRSALKLDSPKEKKEWTVTKSNQIRIIVRGPVQE